MASHQLTGMIALAEKNFDLALSEFQQGNQQDPYNLYRIGLAYEGKGDKTKAKEMYTKALTFNAFANLNQCLLGSKGIKA